MDTFDHLVELPFEEPEKPASASTTTSPRLTLIDGPSDQQERPTLTVEETARLLGISRWLVQQAVRRGELPVVRIGRRILIPRIRLDALLAGSADA
ncbi:MAG: Helix-turn-helix domain [Acidimicrobiaceae bacterium]|jgi:excisionase family DNA binding protein